MNAWAGGHGDVSAPDLEVSDLGTLDVDGPDLVLFAGQDWWYHNRAHSDFQIVRHVSPGRRVLVVNSLGMRMPKPGTSSMPFRRIARKGVSVLRGLRAPVEDLASFHVFTPFFLPVYGDSWLRELSSRMVARQVEAACRAIGMTQPPHVVTTIPTALPAIRHMDVSTVSYNRSDDHSAFEEADRGTLRALEDDLIGECDVVLYSSRSFLLREMDRHHGRAAFLDHGVDLRRFQIERGEKPALLDGIEGPIVGFFGGLDEMVVDFDLLDQVATELPDVNLVLIGDATVDMTSLLSKPNVHFLGFQPYEDIPALGAWFDVGIMPWLDNEWIQACNPIKLKEYLALGFPVVTTAFPEGEFYRDYVHVADDRKRFAKLVGDVLAGTAPAVADPAPVLRNATWADRACQLIGLLDRLAVGAPVEPALRGNLPQLSEV